MNVVNASIKNQSSDISFIAILDCWTMPLPITNLHLFPPSNQSAGHSDTSINHNNTPLSSTQAATTSGN